VAPAAAHERVMHGLRQPVASDASRAIGHI
jgi:hypothetical protein